MSPTRAFLFVRHGQTDWNVEGRMQGHTDIPLNATGLAQAHAAAARLNGHTFTRIVTSPLQRASATAEVIAKTYNIPLEYDERLKERSFGSFEGHLKDDLRQQYSIGPEEPLSAYMPADGETTHAIRQRSREAIAHWLATYPEETVLFVGHSAFFCALYQSLGGPYTQAHNAIPYHFQPTTHGWQLTTL
ncbi:MAG: histidine phosphatase family protein [Pseudomonas fluorescens]|nr:MAG: histidine phosphatase family protein [Pseudomonas fluorescens]